MAYANLLSLEVRRKLEAEFGTVETKALHPAVVKAFEGCREPKVWPPENHQPPQPSTKKAYHHTPDDYPHLGSHITKRTALLEAQNHRCAYCGIAVRVRGRVNHAPYDMATIDHVIPKGRGGRAFWSNEVMACHLCNNGRGVIDAMVYFAWVQQFGREGACRRGFAMQSMTSPR